MKTICQGVPVVVAVILAAGLSNMVVSAQVAQMGTAQIQTEDAAFPGLQAVASDALPQSGTWWLASDTNAPPFPVFPPSLAAVTNDVPVPVYQLGPNAFLVDNRQALAVESALNNLERQLGIKAGGPGRVMTMDSGLPSPPDGGGDTNYDNGDGTNSGGYPHTTLLNPPSNSLYLELWLTNQAAQAFLHGTTNGQVLKLMSALSISSTGLAWSAEQAMHGVDGQDWVSTMVPMLDRTNTLFLWARDWTANMDSRTGFPEWWEFEFFGSNGLAQGVDPNGDLDGDQVCNGMEYTNGTDPNKIQFSLAVTNFYVNTSLPPVQLNVSNGVPISMAVLVDSTNFAGASWIPYNATPAVNLGTNQGWHDLWIGLRGYSVNSTQTWQWARLKLDTAPPQLCITNPVGTNGSIPIIQVQGLCQKALRNISCDVSNATGVSTNMLVLVVDQSYDTNTLEFTTNAFQVFDLALALGPNTVTFHATDWAGNSGVTNWSYSLASGTNPPAVQVYWPADGARISGSGFTVRGLVSDVSAQVTVQVTDTNGVATSVNALVERNGHWWAENLPLSGGTNAVTVTTADAWGNSSTNSLSAVKSGVGVDFWLYSLEQSNVVGTLDTPGYTVWVNGVAATTNEYFPGYWFAYGVPGYRGGTWVVQARAIPNSDNGGSGTGGGGGTSSNMEDPGNPNSSGGVDAELAIDQPPGIYTYAYHDRAHWESIDPARPFISDMAMDWQEGVGGQGGESYTDSYGTIGYTKGWGASWNPQGWAQTYTTNNNWGGYLNGWGGSDYCDVNARRVVNYMGVPGDSTFRRVARQQNRLHTGRAAVGQSHLWVISVTANKPLDPLGGGPWWWTTNTLTEPIAPERIYSGNLGHPDADGNLTVVLPDGDVDVSVQVAGEEHFTAAQNPTEFWLQFRLGNTVITNASTTVFVGQPIGLTCELAGPYGSTPPTPTNWQWTVPGYAVAGYNPTVNSATVDTNIVKTNASVNFYWVDGGRKDVQCTVKAAGQELTAKTALEVMRPEATLVLTAKGHVAVDTNRCDSEFPGSYYMYCGRNCSTNDVGMLFEYHATDLKGYSGLYQFQLIQIATLDWKQNFVINGTNRSKSVTMRGLDNGGINNPYYYKRWFIGSGTDTDSPIQLLLDYVVFYWLRDDFESYLMFKPEGGIPVPIKMATWGWYGRAQEVGPGLSGVYVGIQPFTDPQSATGTNCLDFPHWTNNAATQSWTYQDGWFDTP